MADIAAHVPAPPPKWVKKFARIGLIAKGVVYCLVGILAFMAAFELGGKSTQDAGKKGVFQFILQQPFGKVLLAIVALGLFCYCIWRLIEAIKDTERKGNDAKGIAVRLRYAFSGLVYGALAFYAAKLVLGSGSSGGGGGGSRETMARELLHQPFGQWLVGIVAVGTALAGLYQIYLGLSDKYKEKVQKSGLAHDKEAMMIRAGKIGYVARGIVWIVIGYLFLKAALQANANQAGGSDSAFQWLENSSYGSYILGAVALGLICYGIFMFMRAKYQAINGA
ncbi:DUF1206 domain-containing protein [Pontibacter sp. 172403-2]|uniref:DUF1206 domain-containing protein n=1 Tax=Pontibacter rufus TaxID=2791028 RepID=UPI0018AFB5C6|nr:DUF1206 domain-containing protein [Pontibacter sp. 172403-2]MBF9255548.1 DUF1206 domain-containing protein [Pontibacter sp. 172403-2]